MKRIILWLLLFFSLVCGSLWCRPESTFAEGQKDSYEIILNEEKSEYELKGKVFEETIENAYPGMLLPVRETKIINQRSSPVCLKLTVDLVEPDFSWIDAKLMFIQNGQARWLSLDEKEQSVEDKRVTIKPGEEVVLQTIYQLNGERITNEHQNQIFKLKWSISCRVLESKVEENFPNTGEQLKIGILQFMGIFLILGIIFTRRKKQGR